MLHNPARNQKTHTHDARLADPLHRFLAESERRVAAHCRQLLGSDNLPEETRARLTRILARAEETLHDLAA
jgi:hypothetical protein